MSRHNLALLLLAAGTAAQRVAQELGSDCGQHGTAAPCAADPDCFWACEASGGAGACEPAGCAHTEWAACADDGACEWGSSGCTRRMCPATTKTECEALQCRGCSYSGDACLPSGICAVCAGRPTPAEQEDCCRRAGRYCQYGLSTGCSALACTGNDESACINNGWYECTWDASHSPGYCREGFCPLRHSRSTCTASQSCRWEQYSQKSYCAWHWCSERLSSCDCAVNPNCVWRDDKCLAVKTAACPTMDIVMLVPGSSGMSKPFWAHESGYEGLWSVILEWYRFMPLAGSEAQAGQSTSISDAPKLKGSTRLAFVQFSGDEKRKTPSGMVEATARTLYPWATQLGTEGLSGDWRDLFSRITWNVRNMIGAGNYMEEALVRALNMFQTLSPNDGRRKVLLVLLHEPPQDGDRLGARLRALSTAGVTVLGAGIQRYKTAPEDQATEAALRPLVDHYLGSHMLQDLRSKVLDQICNPWGALLNGSAEFIPCAYYTGAGARQACEKDNNCQWNTTTGTCGPSLCLFICNSQECDAVPHCKFDRSSADWTMNHCVHLDCAASRTADDCIATKKCEWDGATCRFPATPAPSVSPSDSYPPTVAPSSSPTDSVPPPPWNPLPAPPSCGAADCKCPGGSPGKQLAGALPPAPGDCCSNVECPTGTCATANWPCDRPNLVYAPDYQTQACDPGSDAGREECAKCCKQVDPCQQVQCPLETCADGRPAPAPEGKCCGAARCCGTRAGATCPERAAPTEPCTDWCAPFPRLAVCLKPEKVRCTQGQHWCAANLSRIAYGAGDGEPCCPRTFCALETAPCGGAACVADPGRPCMRVRCVAPVWDMYSSTAAETHGLCVEEPTPGGVACDDGNPDTQDDQCDGSGRCVGTRESDKCPWSTARECERRMENPCYHARCIAGDCVSVARLGRPCVDAGSGALGTCSAEGACKAPQRRDDDCSPSNPCLTRAIRNGHKKALAEVPTVCVDDDRLPNNQNWRCECALGMLLVGDQCEAAACGAEAAARCRAMRQECEMGSGGKAQCRPPKCLSYAQRCPDRWKPAPGCTLKEGLQDSNGCPELLTCEWDCPSPPQCTDADQAACDLRARKLRQGPLECAVVNGAKNCTGAGCPLFICPAARPGCVIVDDSPQEMDAYGCPLSPCGREQCPVACSTDQILACEECGKLSCEKAARSWFDPPPAPEPAMVCEIRADPADPAGRTAPRCVRAACPPLACPRTPPGCTVRPGTANRTDRWGCAVCPALQCAGAACSPAQALACCNRPGPGVCRDCVLAAGRAECRAKPYPRRLACRPRAGCQWEPSNLTDGAGCPINGGCGVERCAPLDPCAAKKCIAAGSECRVVGGEAVCATAARGCAAKECPAGSECVWDGGQASCRQFDFCGAMVCPAGMVCVTGKGEAGAARCVPPEEARCAHAEADGGVGCPAGGWSCQPVSTNGVLVGNGYTRYECVSTGDQCTAAGEICDYASERCSVNAAGAASCLPKQVAGTPAAVDPCAAVSCSGGHRCEVDPVSFVTSCARDQCELRCPPGLQCAADGQSCEAPQCTPPCDGGEVCALQGGVTACVADRCRDSGGKAKFAWPPKGSCYSQADCGSDEVCPPRQLSDLSTCISAHCGCDPRTGAPQLCSGDACDPHLRRCVQREWDCGGALQWPAQREWCCRMASTGCPPEEFICDPAIDGSAPEDWPKDREAACCTQAQGRAGAPGCAPAGDYNCLTREEWSAAKRDWCCQNKQIGCPGEGGARDCDLPPARMAADTKQWCCENRQKACGKGQLSQVDCSALRVSAAHRPYCCRTEGRHCAPNKGAYSCTGSTDDWPPEQRRYCCAAAKRGCAPEDQRCSPECAIGSPGCADCAHPCDVAPRKGSARAAWCCAARGVGCEGDDSSGCAELAAGSAERERCCQRWDLGCHYECPPQDDALGLDRLAADSRERQDFCWRVHGVAKAGSAVRPAAPTAISGDTAAPGAAAGDAAGGASTSVAIKIRVDWDAVMGKPKVFVNILLQSLLVLFISGDGAGVASPALLCREVGLLDQDGRGAFDKSYTGPYSAYKLHVGDIFSKAMTTADVDADIAAAARSGRRAHVLRYIRSFTPVDSSDAAYVTVEASAADADSLNRLVDTISTNLKSGQTASTKGGSVLALVPATTGSAVQLLDLPPTAGDDKSDGSSPVAPILATLGGLLALAGVAAVVVRQRRSQGHQGGLERAEQLEGEQGAELVSLEGTAQQYHRTGTDMFAVAD